MSSDANLNDRAMRKNDFAAIFILFSGGIDTAMLITNLTTATAQPDAAILSGHNAFFNVHTGLLEHSKDNALTAIDEKSIVEKLFSSDSRGFDQTFVTSNKIFPG